MRAFPIMRDLVTDVSYNFEVAKLIPAFKPRPRDPDGLYRMAQVDIDRGQEFHKCIECFLCQNVCHVIRDHEENKPRYAGPRFFVRLAELEMHPLDTLDRREYIRSDMGIGLCNITKCCTEVCPEEIHITDNAIIPLKERVVDARYDPIAWLGRKLMHRPAPTSADDARGEYTGAAHAQTRPKPGSPAGHAPPERAGRSPELRLADFLSESWFESLAAALTAVRPAAGGEPVAMGAGPQSTGHEGTRTGHRTDSDGESPAAGAAGQRRRRGPLHDRATPAVARVACPRLDDEART